MFGLPEALRARLATALVVAAALGATGCAKQIGDACTVSADCNGATADRTCDTTQPSGYCTIFSCSRGTCPSEARCVAYGTSVPGCGYDDRRLPRTARSFCLKSCDEDSDCRDGYVCVDPAAAPWNATHLDDGAGKVCAVAASYIIDGAATPTAPRDGDAAVCRADQGDLDGGFSADSGARPDSGVAGDGGLVGDSGVVGDSGAAASDGGLADSGL